MVGAEQKLPAAAPVTSAVCMQRMVVRSGPRLVSVPVAGRVAPAAAAVAPSAVGRGRGAPPPLVSVIPAVTVTPARKIKIKIRFPLYLFN